MGGGGWLEEKIHLDFPRFILPSLFYHLKKSGRLWSLGVITAYLPSAPNSWVPGLNGTPILLLVSGHPLFPPFSPLGEIALLEGLTVVYKSSIDLYFYVIGSSYENEVRIPTPLGFLWSHFLNHRQDVVTGSWPLECHVPLASDWVNEIVRDLCQPHKHGLANESTSSRSFA